MDVHRLSLGNWVQRQGELPVLDERRRRRILCHQATGFNWRRLHVQWLPGWPGVRSHPQLRTLRTILRYHQGLSERIW